MHYQLQFTDDRGQAFAAGSLHAKDDEQAIAKAECLYRSRVGFGYEIWQQQRWIHSEGYKGTRFALLIRRIWQGRTIGVAGS